MQLVLDNTSGALFMVNEAGVIQPGWSAKVTEWFGSVHTDKPYWMMLFESSNEQVKTEMAYGQLVADWLPHELALEQMPSALERGGRYLNVAYSRIHRTSEEVSESPGYLVTIEDVTAEREAAMARRQAQELPNILMRLFEGRAVFEAFCYDTERLFTEAKASVNLDDDLKTLARVLHTLKGNTAIFGFRSLSEAIHEVETRMEVAEDFDLKAEIEDLRARWSEDLERIRPYAGEPSDKGILLTLDEFEGHLDHIASGIPTGELVAEVQRWRDEPVTGQLRQLADAADRIADRLGKEVTVITESNGVRIPDPGCLAEFWSSLVHVVRNAVDHGVEDAEVRKASGKPPAATIRLSCDRRSGWLQVVVADDGPGVPWERLIAKAKANGVDYDDRDLSTLLFAQGLSSRDEVTQVSGRGVGMAAVRETLTALGGRVEVTSEPGVGTHFSFEVPLTNGGVPQGAQREPEVTA
ncbi:MAG: ATP-binding protein [Myxococcota bacterium]